LAQIPSDCITPSFGRETSPRSVSLSHALVGGLGLTNASTLSNATAFGAFSGGSATGSSFSWGEVGIITLQPALVGGDYLGAGPVTGTPSAAVGRFYPARFDTSVVQGCTAGGFTYSGQPMALTVTAKNLAGTTLQNFHATSFANNVDLTDANGAAGTLSTTLVSRNNFTSGVAPATPAFTFSALRTAPSVVKLRVTDADSASSSAGVEATATIRSGRLRLVNAYGSELLALPMSLTAQYWNGSGYVLHTQDTCTSLAVPTSASGMVFGPGNLSAGETTARLRGTSSGNVSLLAGDAVMTLTKPGIGNSGYVDITINTPNWLKYPWSSVTPGNAVGRATFGIYKSPLIYRRENY
jgi:MSHA biogenesis protein MshQ